MFRKMIFLSLLIVVLAAGCFPVGQFEVGVEEPTPVVEEPVVADTPDILDPKDPQPLGSVEGGICFPSEFIPEMTAFFRNVDNGNTYELGVAENQSYFEIELPIGRYIAFAYLDNTDNALGGQYSMFVSCGLSVECVDHSSQLFEVTADQVTTAVDICDWYEPLTVPANPKAAINVGPNLEGFLFINNDTVYQVESGGVAVPLLTPFQPFEIEVSADGSTAIFNHNDDLYVADLGDGTWANLTNTPDRWESNPIFVPGEPGRVFFYTGTNDEERMSGHPGMVNLDGSGYEQLDLAACCTLPAFDSTGSRMAFTSGDAAWIYNLSDGSLEQLNMADYGISDLRFIVSPSFSPDGTKLAWWMVTGESGDSASSLAIFDLDRNTVVRKHVYQPIGGGGANSSPLWSPDGQWVASIILGDGARAALWVISVNSDVEYNLDAGGEHLWSPSGESLVYQVWPEDGGPAWNSTMNLFFVAEGQTSNLDLPLGTKPVGFITD